MQTLRVLTMLILAAATVCPGPLPLPAVQAQTSLPQAEPTQQLDQIDGMRTAWLEINQAGAHFARAVSGAGDVNGDGYSDVIVGARDYDHGQTNEGAAFLYYGSAEGIRDGDAPDWSAESNQAGAGFGGAVSTAGDVNGDGFSDVLIGAFGYDNGQTDEGRAYLYLGSAEGLSDTPCWTAESNQAGAELGGWVNTAGDVNGDGFSDVLVGAWFYENGQNDEGRAFIYYGSADGLSAAPDWTGEGNQVKAHYGKSGGTAGDVNGDGYGDVIVGAFYYDNGQKDEGRAYVYHGSAGGLVASPAWTGESDQAGAEFGGSAGAAGDINGDGYSDVIVGARAYDGKHPGTGRVYVFCGASAGLGASPCRWEDGLNSDGFFGSAVSTAGDMNGDGLADVLIGSYNILSGAGKVTGSYGYLEQPYSENRDLVENWYAEGSQANAYLGYAVASAGDIDGDGYGDVILGAPRYTNGQSEEGRALLYYGQVGRSVQRWAADLGQYVYETEFGSAVATAGDVNGDGFSDILIGDPGHDDGQEDQGRIYIPTGRTVMPPDPVEPWTADGGQPGARLGSAVGSAGDVNGDGYADVLASAPGYTNGQAEEGAVFLYYGGRLGPDSNYGWKVEGGQENARLGSAVGSAGDVNGDGYADILIGAAEYDRGQPDEGQVFLYYGSPSGPGSTPAWTVEGSQEGAALGFAAGTAGDVNGDGYSDVIVGAPGGRITRDGEGYVSVYTGSPTGLGPVPAWTYASGQAGARLGTAAATAGDVNGDGYSDIIAGAPGFDSEIPDQGRAFVFYGSAAGLNQANRWWAEFEYSEYHEPYFTEGSIFGQTAGTAGDMNGDGYSEIFVGAPGVTYDWGGEGFFTIFQGGELGPAPWLSESGNDWGNAFGSSINLAGDVNADGYSDLMIGVPGHGDGNSYPEQDEVWYYQGNSDHTTGLPVRPRQVRADGDTPIAPLGRSDRQDAFTVCLDARTPLGRAPVKLEWQAAPLGVTFAETDQVLRGSSPAWQPATGGAVCEEVGGLAENTLYHWRLRLRYAPAAGLNPPAGRWITVPVNGQNESDLRTNGPRHFFLPALLK